MNLVIPVFSGPSFALKWKGCHGGINPDQIQPDSKRAVGRSLRYRHAAVVAGNMLSLRLRFFEVDAVKMPYFLTGMISELIVSGWMLAGAARNRRVIVAYLCAGVQGAAGRQAFVLLWKVGGDMPFAHLHLVRLLHEIQPTKYVQANSLLKQA